ncbi:hypothetical protein ACFX1W_035270 [Malus domestica]
MELSIAHHGKNEPISDFKKDKVFAPHVDNHGKKPTKEAFTINITPIKTSSAPVKISSKNKVKEINRDEPFLHPRQVQKHLEGAGAKDVLFS